MTALIFTYQLGVIKGEDVIFLRFKYDVQLIDEVKKIVGVRWSNEYRSWYVRDNNFFREKFGLPLLKLVQKLMPSDLPKEHQDALRKYMEKLDLKVYSVDTIKWNRIYKR